MGFRKSSSIVPEKLRHRKRGNEAAKSGHVENYCKELAQRLEESMNKATEDVMKYVTKFNEQVLAILREEEEFLAIFSPRSYS